HHTYSLPHYQHPTPNTLGSILGTPSKIITIEPTLTRHNHPTLTHHNHPECIVYIEVHSWRCTLCGFAQMCNGVYPPLPYQKSSFTTLESLCTVLIPPFHSFLSLTPGNK
uniref:Uncharacterized protein n=1 Tax=Sciurus vulgaris TaxID=55149 RepID=A0A8D2D9J1_SCIVU